MSKYFRTHSDVKNAFEGGPCGSIFNKTAFCLGEKQGMLVNDDCSSW